MLILGAGLLSTTMASIVSLFNTVHLKSTHSTIQLLSKQCSMLWCSWSIEVGVLLGYFHLDEEYNSRSQVQPCSDILHFCSHGVCRLPFGSVKHVPLFLFCAAPFSQFREDPLTQLRCLPLPGWPSREPPGWGCTPWHAIANPEAALSPIPQT